MIPQSISSRRALGIALGTQTLAMLPVFLVGSLAPFLLVDLGLTVFSLGLVVAVFYGTSAIGSATLAKLSDTASTWMVMRIALAIMTIVSFGIAVLVQNGWGAALMLALAGLSNGCIQPASNVIVSRFIPSGRQGLAYGLKQSAIPLATMLGGISVPIIVLALGWRAAFALVGLCALLLILVLPSEPKVKREKPAPPARAGGLTRPALLCLAAMSALGAASANAMAAFLVPSITQSGHTPFLAAMILSLGSLVSILVRICLGFCADKWSFRVFRVVSIMFAGGAVGYLALALNQHVTMITLATVLVFGLGWGWSGLSILGIARASNGAVGAATGITQSGVYVGAVLGPALFGWVAQTYSFQAAWAGLAFTALSAALLALVSDWHSTRPKHQRECKDHA